MLCGLLQLPLASSIAIPLFVEGAIKMADKNPC